MGFWVICNLVFRKCKQGLERKRYLIFSMTVWCIVLAEFIISFFAYINIHVATDDHKAKFRMLQTRNDNLLEKMISISLLFYGLPVLDGEGDIHSPCRGKTTTMMVSARTNKKILRVVTPSRTPVKGTTDPTHRNKTN